MSDLSLNILAGQEVCVASTKAFVNQAALLLRLAARVRLPGQPRRTWPTGSGGCCGRRRPSGRSPRRFSAARDVYVIGRGLTYPVAREIALKIKEISYIHAEGMMGGELKHGTIALIETGTPVISLINDNEPDIISNTTEVEARGARAITITQRSGPAEAAGRDRHPDRQ